MKFLLDVIKDIFFTLVPRKKTVTQRTLDLIKKDWESVEQMLKGGQPSQLKQALITADKTLDNVLKDLVEGNTMGERLKYSKDNFKDWKMYDRVWKAHKTRNSLVHEAGYEPPHYVLKEAVEHIKDSLKHMGVNV